MDKTKRTVILIGMMLTLCFWLQPDVKAQQKTPTPTPTPTPNEPRTEKKMVITPRSEPVKPKPIETQANPGQIFGTIRWKKELGVPFAFRDDGSPTDETCFYGFSVSAQYEAPYTAGATRDRGGLKEENGYYVCRYHIPTRGSLPLNRVFVVMAYLSYPEKGKTWSNAGASLPQGYEYRILDNPKTISLTDSEPSAEIDFEIQALPVLQVPKSPAVKRSAGMRVPH